MNEDRLTDVELDELDRLREQAPTKDWEWDDNDPYPYLGSTLIALTDTYEKWQDDTAYISRACIVVPRLVAEIRSLRKLEEIEKRKSEAMIYRIVTGEGEPYRYCSVPEMLADLEIKDLKEQVQKLKQALAYWIAVPPIAGEEREEYLKNAAEIGAVISEMWNQDSEIRDNGSGSSESDK